MALVGKRGDKNVSLALLGAGIPGIQMPANYRSGRTSDNTKHFNYVIFNENAVEIAKIIESSGAKAITIHPRTRKQGYSGLSDWSIIKKVKDSVSIPVIGNGDIKSCYDAKRMIDETGCDAIMIGRAILGNPWLIKETVEYLENGTIPKKVSIKEKIELIKKHIRYLVETKNEKITLLEMRSHIGWYLKGEKNCKELKDKACKAKTVLELNQIVEEMENNYEC
jgi:nifR3 family TIM-barrel protein